MSLLYIDGFDYYPSGQGTSAREVLWGAAGWYVSVPNINYVPADVRTGRFGFGKAWSFSSIEAGCGAQNIPVGSTQVEGIIGIAVYRESVTFADPIIVFYDASHVQPQLSISLCPGGIINAWRGWPHNTRAAQLAPAGTYLGSSAPGSFQDYQWLWIEVHGKIDNSTGSIEVRVNTVTVLTLTGQDTQNTPANTFDSVAIGDTGSQGNYNGYAFDDLYVCNTAGSVNNTFLGNVRVFTQLTSAAGATTDLSIFGPKPTNWQTVQNTLLDDSQYVYTATNGQFDLYKFQAIVTGTTIFGVQPRIAMRQDDATQVIADIVLATGAFTGIGSDKALNQTYTYYRDMWEENPDTSLPWTQTDTTLYQFGPKKKT